MSSTLTLTGISHVAFISVNVRDVDAAIAFYTDKLGFAKTCDGTMGPMRWVELSPPGNSTRVALLSEGNPAFEPARIGSSIAATFEVLDLAATCKQLEASGVTFKEAPRQEPWGWWAEILDPDGNVLGLHAE